MTPHEHNKILGIIYLGLGVLVVIGTIVQAIMITNLNQGLTGIMSNSDSRTLLIVGLVLMLSFFSTAYGLFRRRRWARILALVLSGLLVFLFPLGTALTIYTWWFLHSEGGKMLYQRSSS
jgi:hypothetical protein